MNISIIIPTYNGAHKILNVIKALEQQTFQDFETIVMIDGSTDSTETVINGYKHSLQSLQVITQTNQGRAKVRNNGAKTASGNLLIFFDDDMRPQINCVQTHLYAQQQHRRSIIVGGINENPEIMQTDIQKYKAYLSEKWVEALTEWKKPLVKENLYLTAANFSISKAIFDQLDGFDECLNDAEDWDLAVRAHQAQIPIYYHHNAFAWHDDFITCQSYIQRQIQYKSFHKKLLILKPDLYQDFSARTENANGLIKKSIFTILKPKFWVFLVDKNHFVFLPKKLRYKLYEYIIAGHSA